MTMRITFFFSQPVLRTGWTEQYYTLDTQHEVAAQRASGLYPVRLNLAGNSTYLDAIRVSNVDHPRDSMVENFSGIPQRGTFGKDDTSDVGWTSILVEKVWDPVKKNRVFMRGVPDDIIRVPVSLASQVIVQSAKFQANFLEYSNALKNLNFAVRTKVPSPGTGFVYSAPIQFARIVRATTRHIGRPFGVPVGRRKKPEEQPHP